MNATDAIKLLPLTLWLRRFRRFTAKLCTHRAHAAAACAEAATAEEQEAPRGCGWFDSSHDLQQGLREATRALTLVWRPACSASRARAMTAVALA